MDQVSEGQSSDYTIREAIPSDLEVILNHRRKMFLDIGYNNEMDMVDMITLSRAFFKERLENGTYRAWLAEIPSREIVAGGGIIVLDYPPSPVDPSRHWPMIVNVYTEPAYRRRGIARRLMRTMVEWCRAQGFGSIMLHGSGKGRPLYVELGFVQTNEMRLVLREGRPEGHA